MYRWCSYCGRIAGIRRETLGTCPNGEYVEVPSEHVSRTPKLFDMQAHISFNDDDEDEQWEKVCYVQRFSRPHHIVLPCRSLLFSSSLLRRHFRLRAASPTDHLMLEFFVFLHFFSMSFLLHFEKKRAVRCPPVIDVPKLQNKGARTVMCQMSTKWFCGAKSFVQLIHSDFSAASSLFLFVFNLFMCECAGCALPARTLDDPCCTTETFSATELRANRNYSLVRGTSEWMPLRRRRFDAENVIFRSRSESHITLHLARAKKNMEWTKKQK